MKIDPESRIRLLEANKTFSFIFHCWNAYKNAPETPIRELMQRHDRSGYCELINPGVALAMAYVYFVIPKETVLKKGALNNLDISMFEVETDVSNSDFFRRLRNSLAHGRIKLHADGQMHFWDVKRGKPKDRFDARVNWAEFGEFVIQLGGFIENELFEGESSIGGSRT